MMQPTIAIKRPAIKGNLNRKGIQKKSRENNSEAFFLKKKHSFEWTVNLINWDP